MPLLLLADDAEGHVRAHLDDGHLFTLVDGADGGKTVGAVQGVARENDEVERTVELTLVAVAADQQRGGLGRRLVTSVLDELRALGYGRALVGTSNAGVGQIAFYQKVGFRLLSIERDHFNEARGYDGTEQSDGIVHRDLVWFDQPL